MKMLESEKFLLLEFMRNDLENPILRKIPICHCFIVKFFGKNSDYNLWYVAVVPVVLSYYQKRIIWR